MIKYIFLLFFSACSLWFLGFGAKPTSTQTTTQQQQNLQARTVYLRAQNLDTFSSVDLQVILPNNTQNLLGYTGQVQVKGNIQSQTYPCLKNVNINCSARARGGTIGLTCPPINRYFNEITVTIFRGQKLKEAYTIHSMTVPYDGGQCHLCIVDGQC